MEELEIMDKIAEIIYNDWGVSKIKWADKMKEEKEVWLKTASSVMNLIENIG